MNGNYYYQQHAVQEQINARRREAEMHRAVRQGRDRAEEGIPFQPNLWRLAADAATHRLHAFWASLRLHRTAA